MLGLKRKRRRINLALQGGGAHGAFTWGVLDRLLEEPDIDVAWLSGTSAGTINAVAMASGLGKGGKPAARETLGAIWQAVQDAAVPDLLRLNPFLHGMSRSQAMGQVASLFSPYDFNPLGFDPLRRVLEAHIDFDAIRANRDVELLLAATDVATGRTRLFRRAELTIEAVLASTCLPTLHHAVQIEGRAYWDGGFTANPDLVTLAAESPVGDTLIVLLNPIEKPSRPRSAREIASEVSRVTFTAPLVRDVAEIVAIAREHRRSIFGRRTRAARLAMHNFHMIEAGRHTAALSPDSKMRPDKAIVTALWNAGREETAKWLARHGGDVGRRSTVDLAAKFLSPLTPLYALPEEAHEDEAERRAPGL